MFSSASLTSASISSFFSCSSTLKSFGLINGFFGKKTVQQSSYGRIDVSYVPICCAIVIVSCLSKQTRGRKIGTTFNTLSVDVMPSMVCDATCPKLSPVMIA